MPAVLAPDTCAIYCVLSLAVVKRASHLSFPDLFDSLERLTDTITTYVVTSRMNVGLLFLQQTISGKRNTWEIDLFCTLASDREATIAHSCYLTTLIFLKKN